LQPRLHYPLSLPHVDEDGDEEMEIVEDGVEDHARILGNSSRDCAGFSDTKRYIDFPNATMNCDNPASLGVKCATDPTLKSPPPSVSPTISSSRKSLKTLSKLSPSQNNLHCESDLGMMPVTKTVDQKSMSNALSSLKASNFLTKTENLTASIRHGLETIDNHHCSAAFGRSSLRLSLRPEDSKPTFPVDKVNVGVQTFVDDNAGKEDSVMLNCNNCKIRMQLDVSKIDNNSNMQMIPVDCPESADKPKKQVLKVSVSISDAFSGIAEFRSINYSFFLV
jgi:kinesin family member 15